MIIIGSLKLSNCAAKIKYTNNNAKPNANKVLEELSWKSLDSPLKSVVKLSSKTLAATASIASIPSPILLPGAKPAETVAEIKRLFLYNCGGLLSSFAVTKLSNCIS